jgi:hypothetical protein
MQTSIALSLETLQRGNPKILLLTAYKFMQVEETARYLPNLDRNRVPPRSFFFDVTLNPLIK